MIVETKFGVGEKVWVIKAIVGTVYRDGIKEQEDIWCASDSPVEIAYIIIKDGITYYTMDKEYYSEEHCFATQNEAEEKCSELNDDGIDVYEESLKDEDGNFFADSNE